MPKSHPDDFREAERSPRTQPAYCYIFEHGEDLIHLTNLDQDIVMTSLPAAKGSDPQTFTAAQITHTPVNQESEITASNVDVAIGLNTAGFTDELREYLLTAVPKEIKVTIIRINASTLPDCEWGVDTFVAFKGVAQVLGFNRGQIQISFLSLLLQMDGQVPRWYYQKLCQKVFGGPLCGLNIDQDQFRLATVLSAVDASERSVDITETALDSDPITDTTFQGGKLWELDGSLNVINQIPIVASRVLPAAAGTRLYLLAWSSTLAAAVDVKVFRGCKRTTADCELHGNLPNFGGYPYIPDFSPAVHGIRS